MLYGWISPEGAFFDCEFMAHYDLAEEICDARGYSTIINGKRNCFSPMDSKCQRKQLNRGIR